MQATFTQKWSDKFIWYPVQLVICALLFGFPFYAFIVFIFEPFPENVGPLILLGIISGLMFFVLMRGYQTWVYKLEINGTIIKLYRPLSVSIISIGKINSISRKSFNVGGRGITIMTAVLEMIYSTNKKTKKIYLSDLKGLDRFVKIMKGYSHIKVAQKTKLPATIPDLIKMQGELKKDK